MDFTPYDLSCSLFGHEKDVRGVASLYFPHGSFISVSRDITARVWTFDEPSGYMESLSLGGHSNFVSCVCTLPPNDDYPHGLILTGSNDHNIHGYTIESPEPLFKLTGHTNTVCALAAGKFGTFVSGSWDHSAKVWFKQKCIMTLEGHEAAVWSVAIVPVSGHMITGSADKTIRIWKAGKVENVLTGHTDCVRCVVPMDPNHFASSSNDTTIRLWDLSGNCLKILTGHNSFVYSLAFMSPNFDLVSCGEDRSLRIWVDGDCKQTIVLPAQSIWCVCVLTNGDIVTGASDGVIRVFTQDPSRKASADKILEFEQSVAKSSIPSQIGDIKTDDLPGPDALNIPGKKEGQIQMIRRVNVVEAYQWNNFKGEWTKVGDVVGGTSDDQSDNQASYEGQNYDYVFDVDIQEGQPPLKLPYNKNEDPYMAAHKFLQKNDLSPQFLDQVAQFIQQQTKAIVLGEQQDMFVDPYTGASRYVVGTGETPKPPLPTSSHQPIIRDSDPFTGTSRYMPGSKVETISQTIPSVFPEKNFLKFEHINSQAVQDKLLEFNKQVDRESLIKEHEFDLINSLLVGKHFENSSFFHLINKLLFWPASVLLPVLDVLRYSFLNESFNQHFFMNQIVSQTQNNFIFYSKSILMQDDLVKNQFMIIRALCNAFVHETGRRYVVENLDPLLKNLISVSETKDRTIHIALATLCVNLSVFYNSTKDNIKKLNLLSLIQDIIVHVSDEEAFYRFLVAVGTIVKEDEVTLKVATSMHFKALLNEHFCVKNAKLDKVKNTLKSLFLIF